MHKDWHDHQKEAQDKLKSEIANKEATICDLMRLNESYAVKLSAIEKIVIRSQLILEIKDKIIEGDEKLISLYKEQNERCAQRARKNKVFDILNTVAVAILCVVSISVAVELIQVKSENQMLKQQQEKPIGERRQA